MTHTRIPEHLGYLKRPSGHCLGPEWANLPADLDRLFRASPKLADTLRATIKFLDETLPPGRVGLAYQIRAALALLED